MILKHLFLGEIEIGNMTIIQDCYYYCFELLCADKGYICRELSKQQIAIWAGTQEISEQLMFHNSVTARQIPEVFSLFEGEKDTGRRFVILNSETSMSPFSNEEIEKYKSAIVQELKKAKQNSHIQSQTWLGMLYRDISIELRKPFLC